jgi:methionyl-tRNA synthetase
MALEAPLPKMVFGHGWFMDRQGGKISKSRGNVQDAFALLEDYGSDAVRYFLLREMQYGADGVYSEDDLVARINVDLANDLGNLVARALAMVVRYFDGVVPAPGPLTELEEAIRALAAEVWCEIETKLPACDPEGALDSLWRFVARLTHYIAAPAPWALAKDPAQRERLGTVLYTATEAIRVLGIFCAPFMPGVPRKLQPLLGGGEFFTAWADGGRWDVLPPGTKVEKGEALFPRIDLSRFEEVEAEGNENHAEAAPGWSAEAISPEITLEDFARIDLRVALVLSAERVPKTDKLLKLEVELDGETRTVVSGIAQHYEPAALVGKKIILVANLQSAKLRGIESRGMILAAGDGEILEVITADSAVRTGARVK